MNFSVPFTDGDWLRRLWNDRSYFSLLLMMEKKTKFVFQVERAFFFSLFLLFSCVFFVYLSKSSFNMTRGMGEDVEMGAL